MILSGRLVQSLGVLRKTTILLKLLLPEDLRLGFDVNRREAQTQTGEWKRTDVNIVNNITTGDSLNFLYLGNISVNV